MSAMNRGGAAPDARSLFASAREDAPDADERDAVFRRIALATGIAAGAAAAASVAPAAPAATATVAAGVAAAGASASVFSLKVLAIGAVIGAVCTALGAVLVVTLAMPPDPAVQAHGGADGRGRMVASGAKLASPQARQLDPSEVTARAARVARVAEDTKPAPERVSEAKVAVDPPSDLAEEARLVTAARTALVAGEPARALSLVQATRKLSARALEPEELGLEARALRALGRADDAAATELVLRRRYPESALAR